ncbi:protein of unknown function [Nitrospira japonica]|uniref:Uncharacterized protein n=1 Tax=Nitrospira japonica TaxID=1325564 RepID=A0A1W1I0V4_9BACT|nr:protein of unknown function [Nitrospira japonica]
MPSCSLLWLPAYVEESIPKAPLYHTRFRRETGRGIDPEAIEVREFYGRVGDGMKGRSAASNPSTRRVD